RRGWPGCPLACSHARRVVIHLASLRQAGICMARRGPRRGQTVSEQRRRRHEWPCHAQHCALATHEVAEVELTFFVSLYPGLEPGNGNMIDDEAVGEQRPDRHCEPGAVYR